ncbi:MAG: MFS transporter [Candidatus Sungbacteria bacterium]|uniref:MFS transporter n=1 Tax=Candidatus Sungiibacteriota bacterium TaxID=2750080 RepID=A0A932YWV7_9BACT|nr:MFS transporter [Parcubacteria group bacterium]MBI4132931.1 MFS transporter [Candidatus Sungbacteria bacterium]
MPQFKPLTTVKTFFATKLSYQVRELYLSVSIVDFAVAMVAIFEPIYLYQVGFSIERILYFYLAVYAGYLIFIPLGAKFARRFGYERAILLGSPFLAAYYLALFLIPQHPGFIGLAIAAFVAQKTFYWPGYLADFARFGKGSERAREISNLLLVAMAVSILGPVAGGLIISQWGFVALFAAATALIFASNLPLLATPERFTPVPFSYFGSFRRLFYRENRRNFFGFLGFGEELIGMVVWPVFIYAIVSDFLELGSIVAASTLATTLALLFVGRMADGAAAERRELVKIGSVFGAGVWLMRLMVRGAFGVFATDALGRTAKNVVVVPMMAEIYDHANQTSIMKTVIFFEMSLIVGKILAILAALAAFRWFPESFTALFVIAALMTLLYSLIKYEPVKLSGR